MGLFDVLSRTAYTMAKHTVKSRESAIRKFEKENPDMNSETRQRLENVKKETAELATWAGISSGYRETEAATRELYSKSVGEWDMEWCGIGMLKDADLSPYGHCVGLYRHEIDGETKYIGRAIELNNGGIRKRLSDYRRESSSARKSAAGKKINEHLDEIYTYVLVVGDTAEAVAVTKRLEGEFIRRYSPEWNKQINI